MNWRERAQKLRAVPLTAVLQLCGAQPDPDDPRKWHTGQGVLTVTGPKFINWNCGRGGGGAIDLVMHLLGLGFGQTLEWLENHFGTAALVSVAPPLRSPLSLPPQCPAQLEQIRRYLIEERRLPPTLLEPLIQSGNLYADARANAGTHARPSARSARRRRLRLHSEGRHRTPGFLPPATTRDSECLARRILFRVCKSQSARCDQLPCSPPGESLPLHGGRTT